MTTLLQQAEQQILEAADTMAAAATSFSGYGYDVFIRARDTFREVVHEWLDKVEHEPA